MFSAVRSSLPELSRASLQANLLAGITVGVIALPLSMALAIASGVPPQHGLYTAIVAGIVIALSGGSRVNISGPTAAFVVILLPIVQQFGLGGLLISGLMAGVILIAMGLARFGQLIEIVPHPVTVGFTAGIGMVIATLQVKDFLGLQVEGGSGHYLSTVLHLARALPTLSWQETLIGAFSLGSFLAWQRRGSRIPAHLVALLAGTSASLLFGLMSRDFTVATIGSRFHYDMAGLTGSGIPPILPSLQWPWQFPGADGNPIGLSFSLVNSLLASAMAIAILGALESLLCAVIADGATGQKHNPDDELIGQGLGNLIVPFFGGVPATAAIARTAASIRAGASSPLASIIHALFVLLAMLSLSPLLSYIPMASMAALLLMVAWNMSDVKHVIRTIRVAPLDDVITLLTCFSLTVIFDMTIAVGIGMGLAAMLFIRRSMNLADNKPVHTEHEKDEYLPREIAIYSIKGPLFFGSANRTMKNLAEISPEIRVVILDMSGVTLMDMSAIVAMESIFRSLESRGVGLVISGLQTRMILKLTRAGARANSRKIRFAKAMDRALPKARGMCE